MKKSLIVAAVAALAGTSLGFDGQIEGQGRPNGISNGGEFRWTVSGAGLDNVVLGPSGFLDTFCVELDETVNPNGTYNVTMNTISFGGGNNAGGPDGFGGDGDPLDSSTAYLFTQFVQGTLVGYEFTEGLSQGNGSGGLDGDENLNRQQTARALQLAIWDLEGEQAIDLTPDNAIEELALYYRDLGLDAENGLISGWAAGSIGKVRVLNVGDDGQFQDQLVMIPLPQAGGLACVGLAGLAVRRRRSAL